MVGADRGASPPLRLAELLASVSLATDLGTGQPMGHAPASASDRWSQRGSGYNGRVLVTVTRTRSSPDEPIEIATIAGEEMLPWLQQIDGFEGLLMLSNAEEATTLVLSFWRDREVAEQHRADAVPRSGYLRGRSSGRGGGGLRGHVRGPRLVGREVGGAMTA